MRWHILGVLHYHYRNDEDQNGQIHYYVLFE